MPSAFSITTGTNAITLDADRRALVVFTVSNQLGRSVRVRTSVSPFAPAPADWFRIEGEHERLFPPGGAEAFNVLIAAPATAPPGQNAFRLDAVSADRPDDEWAHGPLVGFEIPAPPPPVEVPKPVAKGYLETVLGALAGGILATVLGMIANLIVAVLLGVPIAFVGAFFRLLFIGELSLGLALGGGVGAVVALIVRAIPDPAPWRTGLAFGVLAFVLLTILQAILAKAIPLAPAPPGIIAVIVGSLVIVVVAALAGRAYARIRAGGKL